MKCRILLALFAISLLPSLAFANDSPPPQSTTPLLQAIEAAAQVQVPALENPRMPEPMWKTCTANQTCPSGCFISCNGQSSCTVQATSVTCDDIVTSCPFPGCTPLTNCIDPCGYCECRAMGFTVVQCGRWYCFD